MTGRPGVAVVVACPFEVSMVILPWVSAAISGSSASLRDLAALRPVGRLPSFLYVAM